MSSESKPLEAVKHYQQLGGKSALETSAREDDEDTESLPPPLPLEVIERNRFTVAEIQALPRFKDYAPGEPNKVYPPVVLPCIRELRVGRIPHDTLSLD